MLAWAAKAASGVGGGGSSGSSAGSAAALTLEDVQRKQTDPRAVAEVKYERTPQSLGTYNNARPTLTETRGWVAIRGELLAYMPGKSLLGIRLTAGGWVTVYAAVTATRMHIFANPDARDAPADTTVELALAFVENRSAERPLAFCVRSSAGPDLLLAASAKSEYAAWIHAVRFGAPAFRTAVVVRHNRCATVIQRAYRRWRRRRLVRAATNIQRVYRGYRARRSYARDVARVVRCQAYVRRVLARKERDRRRLQGQIGKCHQRRTHIVNEIVATEVTYVSDLRTVIDVFMKPMRALFADSPSSPTPPATTPTAGGDSLAESGSAVASPRQRATSSGTLTTASASASAATTTTPTGTENLVVGVFANFEDIHRLHVAFLADLQRRVSGWTETSPIAQAFLDMSVRLDVYVPFAANYDGAIALLEKARKTNEKFRQFLAATTDIKRLKKLDLFGFLIQPIQRLPRYVMLLKDLLKYTWEAHPDRLALSEALNRMQKATAFLNEAKRREEALRHTRSVIQRFSEPAQLQDILNSGDVVCLFEGPLAAVQISPKGPSLGDAPVVAKRYLLLFSDQLVLTQRTRRTMTDKVLKLASSAAAAKPRAFTDATPIPLRDLVASAIDFDDKRVAQLCGFAVVTERTVYRFFAKTDAERNQWIAQINAARSGQST